MAAYAQWFYCDLFLAGCIRGNGLPPLLVYCDLFLAGCIRGNGLPPRLVHRFRGLLWLRLCNPSHYGSGGFGRLAIICPYAYMYAWPTVALGLRRSLAFAIDEADPPTYCICILPYLLIYGWSFPGQVRYLERTPGEVTRCACPGIVLHKFIRLRIPLYVYPCIHLCPPRCIYTFPHVYLHLSS